MTRTRVLIAEDHQVVGDALATMLSFDDSIVIVDHVTGGAEAVEAYEARHPDLVLMDIVLEGLNGIEATRQIRERDPRARVLMLTMHDDDETVTAALTAGALGYLPKNVDRETLMTAVCTVAAGDGYIHPRVTPGFLDRVRPAAAQALAHTQLSERERRVLELLVDGGATKSIAEDLAISEETVKSHLGSIYRKLGVNDRVQAVAHALRTGLVN